MAGPSSGGVSTEPAATAPAVGGRQDPAVLLPYLRPLLERAAALPDRALTLRDFTIAGLAVRARFTDAGLALRYGERLAFPAAQPAARPDLQIDVLEAAALGWPEPAPWPDGACSPLALEDTLRGAGLRGLHSAEPAPGLWHLFSPGTGRALQYAAALDRLPPWDAGAPLRLPLHWAAAERGAHLVHAATLGLGGAGVLIVGPGGAGKSGTTLAGLTQGLGSVGDDYVILKDGTPPVAYPAYRLLKQDEKGLARFPALRERLAGRPLNWQGKLEFDPEELFPGSLVPELAITAILLASIEGGPRSSIAPLEPGLAFRAFVPSALNQLGTGTVEGFRFFSRLLRRLPTYRLALSADPGDIADTLRGFLARRAA